MLTNTHAQLESMRRSAPANTKLSVSRPARLKGQRAAKLVNPSYSVGKVYRSVRFALKGTEFNTPEIAAYLARKLDRQQPMSFPTPNDIRLSVINGSL